MKRIVAVGLALFMVGCAGKVTIQTSIIGPGGYALEQKISGEAEAVLEAASQLLNAELHVKEGEIDVYINSGQDAVGIETSETEVATKLISAGVFGLLEKLLSP